MPDMPHLFMTLKIMVNFYHFFNSFINIMLYRKIGLNWVNC